MTKAAILERRQEIEGERVEFHREPLLDNKTAADELEGPEEVSDGEKEELFAYIRQVSGIPPDYEPEMTFEEAVKAMSEGMPENWGSREIMRMREE